MLLQFLAAASARRFQGGGVESHVGHMGEELAVEVVDGLRTEQAAVIHFGEQGLRAPDGTYRGYGRWLTTRPVNAPAGSKPASSAYRQKMI